MSHQQTVTVTRKNSDDCTDEQYTIMRRCSAFMHHGVRYGFETSASQPFSLDTSRFPISPSQCTANLARIKGYT